MCLYPGAIIAGAFAVLVALGAGGIQEAVIVFAMVLLMPKRDSDNHPESNGQ